MFNYLIAKWGRLIGPCKIVLGRYNGGEVVRCTEWEVVRCTVGEVVRKDKVAYISSQPELKPRLRLRSYQYSTLLDQIQGVTLTQTVLYVIVMLDIENILKTII